MGLLWCSKYDMIWDNILVLNRILPLTIRGSHSNIFITVFIITHVNCVLIILFSEWIYSKLSKLQKISVRWEIRISSFNILILIVNIKIRG